MYVGLCVVMLFRQSRYVYYPDRVVGLTPQYFRIPYEEVRIPTADGETLAAWFVPARAGDTNGTFTVLFCHGNAGDIGDRIDSIKTFHDLGYAVLIFDYRGYGESTGTPGEKGTYRDAMAAWRYLLDTRGLQDRAVIVFGRSLGGSIAAWLATQVTPGALVLESSFTSARDMAARMFRILPIRYLCRFKYATVEYVRNVKCPVVVAHSTDDEMIPFTHGQRIFEAAPEPKFFQALSGGHNSGGMDGHPAYQQKLKAFLDAHAGAGEQGGSVDVDE